MFQRRLGLVHIPKSWLAMALSLMLLAVSVSLLLALRHAEPAQAQNVTLNSSITTVIDEARSVLSGKYQASSNDYKLWRYRTDNYQNANECDDKNDNNEDPGEEKIEERAPVHHRDGFGVFTHTTYTGAKICKDRNATPFSDNLAHDWNRNSWDLSANYLEHADFQPFLVIGDTDGGGIQNEELALDIWLPAPDLSNPLTPPSLIIEAYDLCNSGSFWDLGSSSGTDFIVFRGQNEFLRSKKDCNGQQNSKFTIDIGALGEPRDKKTFTALINNSLEDKTYWHYTLTVKTPGRCSGCNSYTNQFRLKATSPTGTYLGIPETDTSNTVEPRNAVGIGMRLPDAVYNTNNYEIGDSLGFVRLEVLWEVTILAAIDPEEGCAVKGRHGRFGLYDHDYPNDAQDWMVSRDLPPTLTIESTLRNPYLLNGKENWEKVQLYPNKQGNLKYLHTFGKTAEQRMNQSNRWDNAVYKDFEGDKIYRFRFYNLDQRSWMQIGLPFAQTNALRKCIGKPLVKVYHGDVSVGGDFGTGITGKACLKDNLTIPDPDAAPAIYAHAKKEDEGSFGSSAEYAVYARGTIDAFYSKFKRNPAPPPNPIQQLTFANNDPGDTWGGNWGGQLRCMPNYWREADKLDAQNTHELDFNLQQTPLQQTPLQNTRQFYKPPSLQNMLTIKNTAVIEKSLNLKTTLYVEGDVQIMNNIINENKDLTTLNQINLIYIIVKGDIFIDHSVTQIDAVLIAMPKDDKKGRIYTCYIDDLSTVDNIDLESLSVLQDKTPDERKEQNIKYDQSCREKLTVNGALIARQVHLGRVTKPATTIELEKTITEEINLLPEYFVGSPQLPAHTDWFYKSDSITILPTNF